MLEQCGYAFSGQLKRNVELILSMSMKKKLTEAASGHVKTLSLPILTGKLLHAPVDACNLTIFFRI